MVSPNPLHSSRIDAVPDLPPSKVIELTRASTDETNEESSTEGSAEEKRNEDALEHYEEGWDGRGGYRNSGAGTQERTLGARQATVKRSQINNDQTIAQQTQRFILKDSFIVTSLHHRPWGMGDDNTAIGTFPTEREAKDAAFEDFHQRCERLADGWEYEWRARPGDGMLQLHGSCEDGEDDQDRYTASIKRIQQKRVAAVQPNLPNPVQPKSGPVKPRYVYVVKVEHRGYVGADDTQGFNNEEGDLKAVHIYGVYGDLDAANDGVRRTYKSIVKHSRDDVEIMFDGFRDRMAAIVVLCGKEKTLSISVTMRNLR